VSREIASQERPRVHNVSFVDSASTYVRTSVHEFALHQVGTATFARRMESYSSRACQADAEDEAAAG
jgi:hypothetical protein